MRVAKQYMDTNSINKEPKISRTAQLKTVVKSGVKVCILTETHTFLLKHLRHTLIKDFLMFCNGKNEIKIKIFIYFFFFLI